jgi:YspA, cpYpsA-related SLOG family
MKVIVCGGRDFKDWQFLAATLDALDAETPFDRLATGAAPGADTLADSWARSRGVRVERYYALWRTHGRAAGPIRNQKMLDDEHPDLVIAFPGGVGTADMVTRSKAAGVPVKEIAFVGRDGR